MTSPFITISYKNTFGDILRFWLYHQTRSPVTIGLLTVIVFMTSYFTITSIPRDEDLIVQLITFVVAEGFVLGLFFGLIGAVTVLSMISGKNKTLLTEHTITLQEDSFTVETTYSKTVSKWPSAQKLGRNKSYIFIYVSQHAAHVVPRRAFHDEDQWNAFYDFCKARMEPKR